MTRTHLPTLLLGFGSLLTGCAVVGITDQPTDHPLHTAQMTMYPSCLALPPEHTDTTNPPTRKRLKVLKEGAACWLVVQPGILPRRPEQAPAYDTLSGFRPHIGNGSGLFISPCEGYEIGFPSSQGTPVWYDLDRKVATPCGDNGGGITQFMNFTKLHVKQLWFALHATADNNPDLGQPISGIVTNLCGELTFYVNDTPYERYYDNNQGRLLVLIRRLM